MNKKLERFDLYCMCARESIAFQGLGEIEEDVLDYTFDALMLETDFYWVDLKADNGDFIGFLTIRPAPNSSGTDYDIDGVYIIPEYRRQGYMSKKIKEILDVNPGSYSYGYLVNDEISRNFWDKIISENNCEPISIDSKFEYDEWKFGGFKTCDTNK